jgi:hypothetical protein
MIRVELMNLILTKDALYQLSYMGLQNQTIRLNRRLRVERETRFELATFSLEG